jgi:hypothetical protein
MSTSTDPLLLYHFLFFLKNQKHRDLRIRIILSNSINFAYCEFQNESTGVLYCCGNLQLIFKLNFGLENWLDFWDEGTDILTTKAGAGFYGLDW